jgi:hypothetical protein
MTIEQQPVVRRADPQRSIRRRQHGGNRALLQERRIRAVEHGEIHAIEARQSIDCPKPKVPVGGLRDGANRVVRQSVRRGPDIVAVLRQSQLGVQPPGMDGQHYHRQQLGRTVRHNIHIGCIALVPKR